MHRGDYRSHRRLLQTTCHPLLLNTPSSIHHILRNLDVDHRCQRHVMPVSIEAEGEVYSPAGTCSACLVNRMPTVHLQLTAHKLFGWVFCLFVCVFSLFTVVQLNTCDQLVRFQHVAVLFLRFLFP